ncbi:MAG: sensor histidine kinase [Desulfobacter sp.]|nr:MAG: sensor histidine kinase [Desulfobacter sp.]
MVQFKKFKPAFWDYQDPQAGPQGQARFDFRKKWKLLVIFTAFMALLPLFVMTFMDFRLTRRIIEQELKTSMVKTTVSAANLVSFSIDREKAIMENLASQTSRDMLLSPGRLEAVYDHLSIYSEGIVHIYLVSLKGELLAQEGRLPSPLSDFDQLPGALDFQKTNTYFQETYEPPYIKISLIAQDQGYILQFILNMDLLFDPTQFIDSKNGQDMFLIDNQNRVLTPSVYLEKTKKSPLFDKVIFPDHQGFVQLAPLKNTPVITAYTKIKNTSLTCVLIQSQTGVTNLWFGPRLKLAGYLGISILVILLSIMGTATYLIKRIQIADKRRLQALHHAEYANRLASIGRLASGVAHEINNPLAIVNQKTGLIMDLFSLNEKGCPESRLIPLAKDIQDAVTRCSSITRRLLDFARHMEPSIEPINLERVLNQVLAFLKKEAERREITIEIVHKDQVPEFECDKGSLQQIFLNLVENAFSAMEDGGKLKIKICSKHQSTVILEFSDNGCGIAQEDLAKIFEPFYSSKNDSWGRGLGLATTYGLAKELGGDIRVKSRENKGTKFILTLPLTQDVPLQPNSDTPSKTNPETRQ